MCKIKVVDAPCGYGKTQTAISLMNNNPNKNFIFVTPYLKEIDRIKHSVNNRTFYDPKPYGNKKKDFHRLLRLGKSIATTHSLFQLSTETTQQLIQSNEYILILDEVMNVIQETDITKDDLDIILTTGLGHISENFYLVWDKENYDGEYNKYKIMSQNQTLIVVDGAVMIWKLPVNIFESFKEIYILTYMFDAQIQKYYYDLHDIIYEYYTVNKDMKEFIYVGDKVKEYKEFKNFVKKNVNLYEGKLNNIGENNFSLSYNWYNKNKNNELVNVVKNNIYNYFRKHCKTSSKVNMWTCFKSDKNHLKGKGYTKGFVPCNARATNEFRYKQSVAYPLNRFIKPHFKKFFSQYDIKLDDDLVALSDLIQFIWRSQIRNGKPINLYIPSKRTRNLFKNYLK